MRETGKERREKGEEEARTRKEKKREREKSKDEVYEGGEGSVWQKREPPGGKGSACTSVIAAPLGPIKFVSALIEGILIKGSIAIYIYQHSSFPSRDIRISFCFIMCLIKRENIISWPVKYELYFWYMCISVRIQVYHWRYSHPVHVHVCEQLQEINSLRLKFKCCSMACR